MDLERLQALLALLNDNDVNEFSFSNDDMTLELKLGQPILATMAAPVMAAPGVVSAAGGDPASERDADAGLVVVEAPMVGTFYRAPAPGASNFTEVGQRVTVGQTVCIIEAMKLMNEIEAEASGTVVEILVENAQPVQFGQPIFKIRPE